MKCLYVYNPTSGKQKNYKNKEYILKELKKKFEVVDCKPTGKAGDAGIFARQACGVYDVFVVSGGDGTVNEVINAIANVENRPILGYIPTGTTNDLAHSLKIPKNVKKAVKVILDGVIMKHDIFRVNDRYGIYVCCFGIFTKSSYATSQTEKKHFGRLAYFKYGAKEIFGFKPMPVTLRYENKEVSGNFALGIIANSRYVAGYKVNKNFCYDDGLVNVMLVRDKGKKRVVFSTILRIFRLFLFGMKSLKKNKNCVILQLKKCEMDVPKDTVINLDGENGFEGSFELEVLKQHIQIYVNK